jgi:hydroxymethylglutaryl-CoA lyase
MSDTPLTKLLERCPTDVSVVEVGPRDGLQNEASVVGTHAKAVFVDALVNAGLRHVEVSSFVRADLVPQLADAAEVFATIARREGVRYTALVPNERGLERALSVGVDSIAVLTAASDAFNERNLGCDTRTTLERIRVIVDGLPLESVSVRGYISTALHCPFEGAIDPTRVAGLVDELRGLGINEISLGDTTGVAFPTDVHALLERVDDLDGIALHLHDTHGRALANALVGLQHGVKEYDASAGGLGGCPFAPGAAGNVATEARVELFEGMGISTGVDVEQVRMARAALTI